MADARARPLLSRLARGILLLLALCCLGPAAGLGQDVYKRTDRDGRTVYTNLEYIVIDGKPLEALELRELTQADLSLREARELAQIDERLEGLLSQYQGLRCEQIRAASRGATRLSFLKGHQRELIVALGLLVLGIVLANAYGKSWLKWLMPAPALLGALLLGYTAYDRSRRETDDLHTALRACSSALPEADAASPAAVKERQKQAESLREAIDRMARKLPR